MAEAYVNPSGSVVVEAQETESCDVIQMLFMLALLLLVAVARGML